jgi:hypothetical protein
MLANFEPFSPLKDIRHSTAPFGEYLNINTDSLTYVNNLDIEVLDLCLPLP